MASRLRKEIYERMREECIREYPMPYFCDDDNIFFFWKQIQKEFKTASFHGQVGYGRAICLDNLSRMNYAAMMLGASRAMSYYSLYFKGDEKRFDCGREAFIIEYELEGFINEQRKGLLEDAGRD